MIPAQQVARFSSALPFFLSVILIPLVWTGAILGGWWVIVTPLVAWYLFSAIDLAVGLNTDDADLETTEDQLYWYKLITQLWVPLQFVTLFGVIAYISRAAHLGGWESFGIMFGMGVMTGTVGIVYAHELLHQKGKFERRLGDLLLAMVLYSHFRSEHLLVHHRYVGTPRDPVTARYNEGFHRFYPRVLKQCWHSAFKAERDMLARKKLPWHHKTNPFWLYWGLQAGMMGFALIVGGWFGLMLFAVQASIAIWQLEVVNYVEHYGLTRKHLGDGKYEHVLPRHSWNAAHKATNWLMINLQRHSDHHYKPDRRFPLLQNYSEAEAPQLPHGYPLMAIAAMIPPLWKKIMNPKVRRWRQMYYPEITDWKAYNKAQNPMPR
ncbi:MAG: alkane 1-monooxygenase [Pelagimonas sp.]